MAIVAAKPNIIEFDLFFFNSQESPDIEAPAMVDAANLKDREADCSSYELIYFCRFSYI